MFLNLPINIDFLEHKYNKWIPNNRILGKAEAQAIPSLSANNIL
jgi:hypothetical protein